MMTGGMQRATEGERGGGKRDRARDTGKRMTARPAVGSGIPTKPVALVVSLAKRGRLGGGPFAPSPTSLVRGLAWARGRESRRRRTDRWTDGQGTGWSKGESPPVRGERRRVAAVGCCHGELQHKGEAAAAVFRER